MCAFFRLWALVGKSKNFSVSHCSAGLQKYSAFFSLSTSHSRIIFVSSGSNESSLALVAVICVLLPSLLTQLFIRLRLSFSHRPSEYPLLTQNTKKKHTRCMRTETALETLMVKSEEKKKKLSISISLACWVGVLFGRSAALLVAQARVCV